MKNSTDFAKHVELFLTDYLPLKRNYSKNTILSYKDTLKLFVRFITEEKRMKINTFKIEDFTRNLIIEYLEWLRLNGCSLSTANQRLAAIKSFSYYAQTESIENMAKLQAVESIKSRKTSGREISFLTEEQMKLLLNTPDIKTRTGLKHKLILCLLYDTGARVQELCDISVGDVFVSESPKIKLKGKGNKIRVVPISKNMSSLLSQYLDIFHKHSLVDTPLILNKNKFKITRDGIEHIIKKYASNARLINSSFPIKVHPHMFRHSKAMHMLAAEIPIVYIRDFLGHEEISTTMIYAKADNRLKEKAINQLAPKIVGSNEYSDWTKDQGLMEFLQSFK